MVETNLMRPSGIGGGICAADGGDAVVVDLSIGTYVTQLDREL